MQTLSKYAWSAITTAGAGGDRTTTVVTAPMDTTLVATIGVIIIATIATTIDDKRERSMQLRSR
jgi:hypothetical protein